jgi:hypothetical protein
VKKQSWLREHSLSLVFAFLYLAFSTATVFFGQIEFTSEQEMHGLPYRAGEFWQWWGFEYTMSLVADLFGALALVVFTKRFYERGSAESRED